MAERTVIVTGAASGIGAATALRFASLGDRVVCWDVDPDGLADTARNIAVAGADAIASVVDITDRHAVLAAVQEVVDAHGPVGVLANVAGIIRPGSTLDVTEADIDAVWAVNVKGTLFAAQAVVPSMAAAGAGVIVNTASAAIDHPSPGLIPYSTSKAAVAQLTRTMAAELGPSGIRVNAVAPGFIDTAMTQRHSRNDHGDIDPNRHTAMLEAMRATSPLDETGVPDDIAAAICFLASADARFVTGQIWRVNGGVAMPL